MKAISLWQPWGSAICAGLKTIERRVWRTSYVGPIAIHAAEKWNVGLRRYAYGRVKEKPEAMKNIGIEDTTQIPSGAIIATATLWGCETSEKLIDEIGPTEESWGNY